MLNSMLNGDQSTGNVVHDSRRIVWLNPQQGRTNGEWLSPGVPTCTFVGRIATMHVRNDDGTVEEYTCPRPLSTDTYVFTSSNSKRTITVTRVRLPLKDPEFERFCNAYVPYGVDSTKGLMFYTEVMKKVFPMIDRPTGTAFAFISAAIMECRNAAMSVEDAVEFVKRMPEVVKFSAR